MSSVSLSQPGAVAASSENPGATASAPVPEQSSSASVPGQVSSSIVSESMTSKSDAMQTTPPPASSTSATTSETPRPGSGDHNLARGTLGGVGIACVIGGALLVGLIWFLMSRRSRGHRSITKLPEYSSKRQRPHFILAPPPAPRRQQQQQQQHHKVVPSVGIDLDELPQEAPHDELRKSLSQIETAIKNWVLQFFQESSSALGKDARRYQELMNLLSPENSQHQPDNKGSPTESLQWFRQLHGKKQGTLFLRAYVARLLFDRIDPIGDPDHTMLPRRITRFYQDMLLQSSSSERAPGAGPQLLPNEAHYWRSTTMSLVTRRRPSPFAESDDDENAEAVANLGTQLLEALQPMRRSRVNERCLERFGLIARNVAQLGLRLFAQTHPVRVYWPPPDRRGHQKQLVVFPGLKQYRLDSQEEICVVEPRVESWSRPSHLSTD